MQRCLLAFTSSILVVSLAFVCGCGGGGGGASAAIDTGTVAVVVADAPTDAYRSIHITLHEVCLLPLGDEEPPVPVFESPEGMEIDLLDLRDEDFLLAVKRTVRIGTYDRIRIRLSRVRAVGGSCGELDTLLESGAVDLNLEKRCVVRAGATVSLRLDFDADKSLQLNSTVGGVGCTFRPVVLIDLDQGPPLRRCLRSIPGTITELVKRAGQVTGFILDRRGRSGELEVLVSSETEIFNEAALPGSPADLEVGQSVRVRGTPDGHCRLKASVVVIGKMMLLDGIVMGPVDGAAFPLAPLPGEEVDGKVQVNLSRSTFVLLGCAARLEPEAIQPGMRARVIGKLDAGKEEIQAVVILLRHAVIRGELEAMERGRGGYELTVDTSVSHTDEDVVVFLPDSSTLRLQGDGPVPPSLLASLVDCEETSVDVRVLLEPRQPGTAASVCVEADAGSGLVEHADLAYRTLVVDGKLIRVMDGARILHLGRFWDRVLSLHGVELARKVLYFGLEACPGDRVDFYAFVVILLPAWPDDH